VNSTAMNEWTTAYGQFARHSNENSCGVRLTQSGAINARRSKGALVRTELAGRQEGAEPHFDRERASERTCAEQCCVR